MERQSCRACGLALVLACGVVSSAFAHDGPSVDGGSLGDQAQLGHFDAPEGYVKVHGCFGDEHGRLSGGVHLIEQDPFVQRMVDALERAQGGVEGDNRVDIVFVGDGYTAAEMAQFHADVDGVLETFFFYEPFKSYEPYFRITRVEVVSNESGVDNDPTQGIERDTALDMGYWCGGTERLLCVDVSKAYAAAFSSGADVDQVIAIANSSKYGGAGYPSNNLGTVAGSNGAAADIAIHEFGHSFGDLADEYTYGGPTTYTGPELGPADVSIYNRTAQLAQERKWWRWMDANASGFDGPTSTYEGGNYSQFGVFRPSNNSMMRSLGRPFNLPSAEEILKKLYGGEVDPIDDGTPGGAELMDGDVAWVLPMQPLNHDLNVIWYLDGVVVPGLIGATSVEVSSLGAAPGSALTVEVIDGTPWVRNPQLRENRLTSRRTFTIVGCDPIADLTGDGELDFFDVSAFLQALMNEEPVADFSGDGQYDFFDVSAFLQAMSSGECAPV